jgi:hypothetical protein
LGTEPPEASTMHSNNNANLEHFDDLGDWMSSEEDEIRDQWQEEDGLALADDYLEDEMEEDIEFSVELETLFVD